MSAVKRRHEHAPGADEADVRETYSRLGLIEGANLGFFLGVGAHNADTGKIFLTLRCSVAERGLNFFVEFVNCLPRPDGDGHDRSREQTQSVREGESVTITAMASKW